MTKEEKKTLTPLMTSAMGALNGLLIGLIAEEGRVWYLNHRMGLAAREYARTDWAVDFVDAYRRPLVPLICILSFAAVSYLVHRYFIRHPRALLFLWLTMGVTAVSAGYFMSTTQPNAFAYLWILTLVVVSYSVHRLWTKHRGSFFLLWLVNGISALIVVALGVQLVGLFFYWPELRSPLLWLLCLLGVIATSMIYGAVVQFILNRFLRRKFERANA
jgi:hypothetical protein